jgi:hypothetical protein
MSLDGVEQGDDWIPLSDDGQTHDARIVMGEKVVVEESEPKENQRVISR